MRPEPCSFEVRTGICQPCHERAGIPCSCRTMARRPAVTCSPEATTASYSRRSQSFEASSHQPASSLVFPAMAETTTAMSWPACRSRAMCLATLRMRSMFATEVPPNFITRRDIRPKTPPCGTRFSFRESTAPAWRRRATMQMPAHRVNGNPVMPSQEKLRNDSTIDPEDVARFDRLGAQWWDRDGPMQALHRFNPVRVAYLRELLGKHFLLEGKPRDWRSAAPLDGLTILDIGCGAGILAEPLARLGARMTAIDPAGRNIEVAREHSAKA